MMKERGTFHVPTISAVRGIIDHPDEVPAYAVEKGNMIAEQARESFRRAMRAGVRPACGTDAGTPFNPHGNGPLEVVRMVEWGLTPLKALQRMTRELRRLGALRLRKDVRERRPADRQIAALARPRRNRGLHRTADHLLDGCHNGVRLPHQPVQQSRQVLLGDGIVLAAAVADVMQHDLHPSASVLLGLGDIRLDRR